ncbi:MAG TPA: response regulator [Ktedonobacterales bacterium]|jgi:CheY-like chemotaxis protein|nr:response regulator [Ktedonobacterales bacterium]
MEQMEHRIAEVLKDRRDGERTNILVVDDDETTRTAVRSLLEQEGSYEVAEVSDAKSAYALLRVQHEPSVVLNYLRDTSPGQSLLRRVHADEGLATRHVYLCLTSSESALPPEVAQRLDDLNAPVLHYPCDHDTLGVIMAAAARRAAALARQANSAADGTAAMEV